MSTRDVKVRNHYADGWTSSERRYRNDMVAGSKQLLDQLWYKHPDIMRHLTRNKGAK